MDDERYYRRKPKKILDATTGWDWQLKGIYSILIDIIMLRDDDLPDDPGYIAGHIGCTKNRWTAAKKKLVEFEKIQIVDGKVIQTQAKSEQNYRKSKSKQASLNRSKPNKINNLSNTDENHRDRDRDRDKDIDDKDSKLSSSSYDDDLDLFSRFWGAYPRTLGQPEGLVLKEFQKQDQSDKIKITEAAESVAGSDPKKFLMPLFFIRERAFDGIKPKPKKMFVVRKGSPEWAAWSAFKLSEGKTFIPESLTVPAMMPPQLEETA